MASDVSVVQKPREKLPKLPSNAQISKRRLTRAPITVKGSSSPQIIYVSSRTPFMSAISRIRKRVSSVQKRRSQSVSAVLSKKKSGLLQNAKGDRILAAAIESLDRQETAANGGLTEEVLVKGTGKAIEKVLRIAGWLQSQGHREGVRVKLETGSWWAVDDVEVPEGEQVEGMDVDQRKEEAEEVPDSRLRSVSVLTIRVGVI